MNGEAKRRTRLNFFDDALISLVFDLCMSGSLRLDLNKHAVTLAKNNDH